MREIDDSQRFIGRTGEQPDPDASPNTVPGAARWLAATPSASGGSLAAAVRSAGDDERYAHILELVDATVGELAP